MEGGKLICNSEKFLHKQEIKDGEMIEVCIRNQHYKHSDLYTHLLKVFLEPLDAWKL